jgi:hypothetical protein
VPVSTVKPIHKIAVIAAVFARDTTNEPLIRIGVRTINTKTRKITKFRVSKRRKRENEALSFSIKTAC